METTPVHDDYALLTAPLPGEEDLVRGVCAVDLAAFGSQANDPDWLEKYLRDRNNLCLISQWRSKRETAGYLIANPSENDPLKAYVCSVGVAPAHQRQGLAKQLLFAAAEELRERRFRLMEILATDERNFSLKVGRYFADRIVERTRCGVNLVAGFGGVTYAIDLQ